jgi:hypothetical protein
LVLHRAIAFGVAQLVTDAQLGGLLLALLLGGGVLLGGGGGDVGGVVLCRVYISICYVRMLLLLHHI